jgi:hypothetical protein
MQDQQDSEKNDNLSSEMRKLDLNSIATIGAVILSIIAISISVLEVTTMRTQQKATVWPYIQVKSSYSADSFKISLENKGIGPALIKNFELLVDDKPQTEFDSIISQLVGPENAFSYDVYRATNPGNSVVSSRENLTLLRVPLKNRAPKKGDYLPGILFAEQAGNRFNISICYCSIYDDCWVTDLKMKGVEEVKSCL